MAHKIPRCIEWVSSIHPLEPGDVLATGTNHRGLSAFQDGDQIELETDGLGRLRFHVRDDLKRTWARETRLDRQEKKLEGTTPQLTGKYAPAALTSCIHLWALPPLAPRATPHPAPTRSDADVAQVLPASARTQASDRGRFGGVRPIA